MAKTVSKKKRQAADRRAAASRWGTISNLLGGLAFVQQATIKDQPDIAAQQTIQGKLKVIANSLTGHISGFNFFKDVPQKTQNFNPAGALNKWTYAGAVLAFLYPRIPVKGLLYKGPLKQIGKRLFIAGVAGGIIDDPEPAKTQSVISGAQHQSQLRPSVNFQSGYYQMPWSESSVM